MHERDEQWGGEDLFVLNLVVRWLRLFLCRLDEERKTTMTAMTLADDDDVLFFFSFFYEHSKNAPKNAPNLFFIICKFLFNFIWIKRCLLFPIKKWRRKMRGYGDGWVFIVIVGMGRWSKGERKNNFILFDLIKNLLILSFV